ncbi:MAG TPA: hypothetical protein PKM73_04970 [Verrucomicrobiota bacterium]|nr:hypothetical protein [Verrucomicrobiota bacterium]HNU50714.1 hypothetical protein [Verrucomicrobiota bacterium]
MRTRSKAALMGLIVLAAGAAGRAEPEGRTGWWRFDRAPGLSERGGGPRMSLGIRWGPSFDGLAAGFFATNGPVVLAYPETDPAGVPNFARSGGAVRFLFKPSWARARAGGAAAPGHEVRLFEAGYRVGETVQPQLALSLDPQGTNLSLATRDAAGVWRTHYQVAVDWPARSGGETPIPEAYWREVLFNYSAAGSGLFVAGQLRQDWKTKAWSGSGVVMPAPPANSEALFSIGSSLSGEWPAEGWIDELETFDRPLTPLRTYGLRQETSLSAAVLGPPWAVRLEWCHGGNERVTVRRRALGGEWTIVTKGCTGFSYTDSGAGLETGRVYEYEVGPRRIQVALACPPVETRGRVILLVDRTLASAIAGALEVFRRDLTGDGWSVIQHEVARHPDAIWGGGPIQPAYQAEVRRVKGLVVADYQAAPDLTRAVVIVGHGVVPYSGMAAEDGHPDHQGAWPADTYYGDMDGVWRDTSVNNASRVSHPLLRNVPGDGKFDPNLFRQCGPTEAPSPASGVELAVGRIDFARLPGLAPRTETELIRQYFAKNHRYRHGQMAFPVRVMAAGYFWSPFEGESRVLYASASALASRLYGLNAPGILEGNAFAPHPACLWSFQGGFGGATALHTSVDATRAQGIRKISTADLAQAENEPHVAFHILKGSYFGDWNLTEDNFLRAVLGTPNFGLAAWWTRSHVWEFDPLARGEPLGAAMAASARGDASVRTTSLMGDPTLRAFVTAPPASLEATRRRGGVVLRWDASPEAEAGYAVLRAAGGKEESFSTVHRVPAGETGWTDPAPPAGRLVYQVRALRPITTGSGTFINNSQGLFVTVK